MITTTPLQAIRAMSARFGTTSYAEIIAEIAKLSTLNMMSLRALALDLGVEPGPSKSTTLAAIERRFPTASLAGHAVSSNTTTTKG
jgi:hypothetical protein